MKWFFGILTSLACVLVLPAAATAASLTWNFDCHLTFPSAGTCSEYGSYGSITLTDSAIDSNRIDIKFVATPPAGYGQGLEKLYLNFVSPFQDFGKFYLTTVDQPVNGPDPGPPYPGQIGGGASVAYSDSNSNFLGFFFDVVPYPAFQSLTFDLSLGLYNEFGTPDLPVNLDVSMFNLTTSSGTPRLYAGYRTHNGTAGDEFHAGASSLGLTSQPVPEPTSLLLLGGGLLAAVKARRRGRK